MLPPPTTQWSSVLHSTRSALAWREEHNGTLRVQLRLVNRRGLFLAVFFGLLFLTAVSVGVLAHLHVKGQFYALVLSPVLVFLLLAITYRGESRDIPHFRDRFVYPCFDLLNQSSNLPRAALAPIEEFIFERETRTVNSTTASTLCGVRGAKLTGVHRVEVVSFPYPSACVYGLPVHLPHTAQVASSLRLVIYHDQGEALSTNVWPIDDAPRLRRALMTINAFLGMCSHLLGLCGFKAYTQHPRPNH